MTHLSIIGAGKIGGEVAYLSAVLGIADKITITDCNSSLLHAQKLDIIHTGLDLDITTDLSDLKNSDIIVFTAGLPRNPTVKTRADLLNSNIPVADEFCSNINGFKGIVINVTNPVDALNYYICKKAGLNRRRCIGFGGLVDLARFENFLNIRGFDSKGSFVMGEHGEHQVPVFSDLLEKTDSEIREEILSDMKNASMPVIKGKGGTVFGPAFNIIRLVSAIKEDKKEILPCSCILEGEYGLFNLSIGVPARIGKEGVEEIIEKQLDDWELDKLKEASVHLKNLCRRAEDAGGK
ncbi:lactate dehydrogenase [Methanomicrobium antiquum]|uniref:malate dehydrogenase n=1 Tax=Methanomicrobium antiquum TaxID=487686 RepID=A0AAF0FSP6_9EURY|nr:lactate dehydrogenase [Methanomicrobium antiquum]WFN35843.1 lactate dehydrogenase [Methanomicrobium antiquum]